MFRSTQVNRSERISRMSSSEPSMTMRERWTMLELNGRDRPMNMLTLLESEMRRLDS